METAWGDEDNHDNDDHDNDDDGYGDDAKNIATELLVYYDLFKRP